MILKIAENQTNNQQNTNSLSVLIRHFLATKSQIVNISG